MTTKEHKEALLKKLYAPLKNCIACPLGTLGRTQVVFGAGNPDARLMLIGEGPGQEEDLQGIPFVGRSGKLLTKILESIGLQRSDIYISNIVKCRPPSNRKPTPLESSICKKLLLINQVKIIRPTTICTLGAAAIEGLIAKPVQITKIRGSTLEAMGTTIIPTLHPAYILRNPKALNSLVEDLIKAKELSENPKIRGGG